MSLAEPPNAFTLLHPCLSMHVLCLGNEAGSKVKNQQFERNEGGAGVEGGL